MRWCSLEFAAGVNRVLPNCFDVWSASRLGRRSDLNGRTTSMKPRKYSCLLLHGNSSANTHTSSLRTRKYVRGARRMNPPALVLLAFGLATGPILSLAADDQSTRAQGNTADSGLYIKVHLSNPVRMSKLKSGDVVQGSLTGDVYSADRKLFPSGSAVRLTVDHLEKRKRTPNDHWPWVVNAFTPRHENYPVFKNATVAQDQGETSVQVSMISSTRMREVHAKAKKNAPAPLSASASSPDATTSTTNGAVEVTQSSGKKLATPTLVLEAFGLENSHPAPDATSEAAPEPDATAIAALPAGTHCKILLLGTVSASKSKPGDPVRARLLE